MKALSCLCAAVVATIVSVSGASAHSAPKTQVTLISDGIKVSHHHHRHGDLFGNWCAYNCYRVSRYARPPLGRYGYSQLPYDQDLPFPYRWDMTPASSIMLLPCPNTTSAVRSSARASGGGKQSLGLYVCALRAYVDGKTGGGSFCHDIACECLLIPG